MTTPRTSFGVSRRILLSSLALLPALIGPMRPISALAQTPATDPLPSWNDTATKNSIVTSSSA